MEDYYFGESCYTHASTPYPPLDCWSYVSTCSLSGCMHREEEGLGT